jgi:hypothetical protein
VLRPDRDRRPAFAGTTSVSVYRSRANGCFSDRELDRPLMPILMASVDLHCGTKAAISGRRSGTIEEIQGNLKSRHPRMSTRELEVAARLKAGCLLARSLRTWALPKQPSSRTATALPPAWEWPILRELLLA